MRLSLGIGTSPKSGSSTSVASDALKGARQAIRSQAAAREYVERQLAHAETTMQELRTKLHHAHREKDAAVEAARFATAAKLSAERTIVAAGTACATEKAARDRADRALREARATIDHLQAKADAASRDLDALKAELEAERRARQQAECGLREARQVLATNRRDTGIAASPDLCEEAAVSTIRRPIGRPRKIMAVSVPASSEPIETAIAPNKGVGAKAGRLRAPTRSVPVSEPQPVEWWVAGWDRRRV